MALSATVDVAENALSKVIAGVFFPPYQVMVQTSWVTPVAVLNTSSSSFTIDFGVPAPAGATLQYLVVNVGQPIGFAETEIANVALAHIADRSINALTEANTRANLVKTHFWTAADEALADHTWRFAIKRSPALAQGEAPSFGPYGYAYQLPSEPFCLRVLETDQGDGCQDWEVEGRMILANISSLKVRYIARITDTGVWAPSFITCFSYLLASRMAYALTKSLNLEKEMFNIYQERLVRARTTSGLEGVPRRQLAGPLVRVR